jgi:hypothetical protein
MKRNVRPAALLAAALLAAFAGGCKSENVIWYQYPSTTFAELSLPPNAILRIVSSKDESARTFASRLRRELAKSEGIRIVGEMEEASHLVFVQGSASFRGDTAEQVRYTGRVSVETMESESGSFQRVKREQGATHAAAREISLAVYATKTLSPLAYLSFPIYESGASDEGALDDEESERESRKMQDRFTKLAVSRLEEIFTSQRRPIRVPVPVDANGDLKVQFLKIESAVGANDREELDRTLDRIDALASNPSVLPGTLEEFATASAAEDWEPPAGTTRETYLGNYYLVALRREIGCTDPEELSEIHAEMLRILELSEDPSLQMACPLALGRLEEKLARLRAM